MLGRRTGTVSLRDLSGPRLEGPRATLCHLGTAEDWNKPGCSALSPSLAIIYKTAGAQDIFNKN